jgi:branched-chain amino acid transport system permease protein
MTRRTATPVLVVLAACVVLPVALSDYRTGQLAAVGAYFVAILGLDLLWASGQVSLGQGGFMALGAYTTVILVDRYDVRDLATVPVAAAVAGGAGLLVALTALRRPGLYLALATFGVAAAIPSLADKFDGLTGGAAGLSFDGSVHETGRGGDVRLAGLSLSHAQWTYALTWAIGAVLLALAWRLVRSPFGRSLRAARESARGAAVVGLNATAATAFVAAVSAAYAGIAGSLVAIDLAFFSPRAIPLQVSLYLVAAAVLGLYGSIWGALAGAFLVEYLGALVGTVPRVDASRPGPTTLAFGVLLVALVLARPLARFGAAIAGRKQPGRGERS